jgi:ketosteroid isomerase-like protein
MSERDEFLGWVTTELKDAERALNNGDADGRRRIWSRREPVTVFGASKSALGRADVEKLFNMLEQRFSDCTAYDYEVVAADISGDMAYTVGCEHIRSRINGQPVTYTLRATQIYRREEGQLTVIHRHGDTPPDEA